MNKSLRDVAKVLYEVEDSICCKVCVICKEKGHEDLSCVDCIEDGLEKLIDRATPMKPIHSIGTSMNINVENILYKCPTCKNQIFHKGDCCSNNECHQVIDWSDEDETNII